MPIYDISVPITAAQTPVYPGDPDIRVEAWSLLAKGDVVNLSMLHFGAHTGTHVDAPAHFIEGGRRVHELPLEILVGAARVIEIPDDAPAVDTEHVTARAIDGATRVLFKTRNSRFWQTDGKNFREDFAYVTPAAAQALVRQGVQLVGIDYLSIEQFNSQDFGTHLTLLSNNVVIIEGLNLSEVPAGVYELSCLPLRIADGSGDGAPARAILRTV